MKLDPQKAALLTLDLQKGVFGLVTGSERVMPIAAKAVAFARPPGYLSGQNLQADGGSCAGVF
jgi:hypothetical protein